jgi:elongation factor P
MSTTGDIGVGSIIRYNNELVRIEEYIHRTPGNLRAFYQAKMRNLKNGKLAETRFRSGEEVEVVRVEYKEMQYLYPEGELMVVMDQTSYDQIHLNNFMFGDALNYIKENDIVKVAFENDEPILAEAPTFVTLTVSYAEPGVKGDTATNTLKPAKVETGATVNIPLFVNEGDKIKVDTRTGAYVERVKD